MNRLLAFSLALAVPGAAADPPRTRPISLGEVVRIAQEQDPSVLLAQLEVEKSASDVRLVRAEGSLQARAGSGLGATSGIPQSVLGASPSVAHLTVRQPLLDFGRSRRADKAQEMVTSSEHAARAAAERASYRAGVLYLDFELASREIGRFRSERDHFERIEQLTASRVREGLEIPLALARARLDTARALERIAAAESRYRLLEADLRQALGIGEAVRLEPMPSDTRGDLGVAMQAGQAQSDAGRHPDVAAFDARIRAVRQSRREARSGRYPSLDIVGQYALLARFNNYDDFFRRFERHNWQAGVALQVPLFGDRGVAERVARSRLEERELELRQQAKLASLRMERQRALESVLESERQGRLARQELDYARDSLDVLVSQYEEGRIPLAELERARVVESTAWGGFIESRYKLAKDRLALAHVNGRVGDALAD